MRRNGFHGNMAAVPNSCTNSWRHRAWIVGGGKGDRHWSCDVTTPRSSGHAAIGTPAGLDVRNPALRRVRGGDTSFALGLTIISPSEITRLHSAHRDYTNAPTPVMARPTI